MIVDLHIHSKYSFDSILEPSKIIKVAKEKDLAGVAITDHGTIKGALEAKRFNQDPNFLVIVGCEVNTDIGDIIGLFLRKELLSRNSREVIEEIKEQGGIVVLPHPCRDHKLTDDLIEYIDIIESFNSRSNRCENFYAKELAMKHNKPMIAGSDAHLAREIGSGTTFFKNNNTVNIYKDLLTGNCSLGLIKKSPIYFQNISQIIKSIKIKNYHSLPFQFKVLIFSIIKNMKSD
jgi:predicted metal-dependent phosphoesterase TrpH